MRRDTGLERLHPHQVRHTAFTTLVRRGVDRHTIKRIAGHASVTTTEAYMALSGEDMKAKLATASPFEQIRADLPQERRRRRLRSA